MLSIVCHSMLGVPRRRTTSRPRRSPPSGPRRCCLCFIGWSNIHFNNLHVISSQETTEITTCAAEHSGPRWCLLCRDLRRGWFQRGGGQQICCCKVCLCFNSAVFAMCYAKYRRCHVLLFKLRPMKQPPTRVPIAGVVLCRCV